MLYYLMLIESPEDVLLFEELYVGYRKGMKWKAGSILRNENDTEDAVHDVFVNLAKNMDVIRKVAPENRKRYLFSCVSHAAYAIMEKNRGEVATYEEYMSATVELEEESWTLQCIAKLPPNYRYVLELKHIHGLTLKEVAKSLGITESAAKQRHKRGKEMLEKLLAEGEVTHE